MTDFIIQINLDEVFKHLILYTNKNKIKYHKICK